MEKSEGNYTVVRYLQFYNRNWEKLPIFKGWLSPVSGNRNKAYCKYCKKEFRAHRTDLRCHARSKKHQKAGAEYIKDEEVPLNINTGVIAVVQTDGNDVANNRTEVKEEKTTKTGTSISLDTEAPALLKPEISALLKPETSPLLKTETSASLKNKTLVSLKTVAKEVPLSPKETVPFMHMVGGINKSAAGGISTQVLDLVRGAPVSHMAVKLWKENGKKWIKRSEGITDADGRCNLLKRSEVEKARYKLHFEVKKYFTLGLHDTFYPFVEVTFDVSEAAEDHNVPLLLSPYGYMVYRGS